IGLVAHRIPALIGGLEDIAIVARRHLLPDGLRGLEMARLGGADEIVVGEVQRPGEPQEFAGIAVGKLAHRNAFPGGGLHHLDAVLVRTGEEIDLPALEPLPARNGVGGDHLIGMPDMGGAIGIGNRGRDVKGLAVHTGSAGLAMRAQCFRMESKITASVCFISRLTLSASARSAFAFSHSSVAEASRLRWPGCMAASRISPASQSLRISRAKDMSGPCGLLPSASASSNWAAMGVASGSRSQRISAPTGESSARARV